MKHTASRVAVAIGALLLLIFGAALVARRPATEEDSKESSEADTAPSSGARASNAPTAQGVGLPKELKPKEDQLPMPGCWQGVAELDKNLSMANFQQALAAAISGRDRMLADYLQARLTDLIGDNPTHALQALEWAQAADNETLSVYIEAVKASAAVHRPEVVERILKMGEDKGSTFLHRGAALDALDTQKRFTPATMARVKAIALDESLDSVSWIATRSIGRVMKEEYERTGTFSPYWKELLDISEKSDDMAVKLLALEMPSYSNPIIGKDPQELERLAKIMRTDRERDVREMAAFRLAVTEQPDKALEYYRTAFPQEQDECVRWALFRFAVRAAGAGALPLLQQMAAQDPRFLQDYQDFQKLYAEGTVDFARIWLGKEERHSCIMEEGAPH